MNYARNEGDLVKEELLWYFLLDVWRNPEKLKDLTADCVADRLKLVKQQFLVALQNCRNSRSTSVDAAHYTETAATSITYTLSHNTETNRRCNRFEHPSGL